MDRFEKGIIKNIKSKTKGLPGHGDMYKISYDMFYSFNPGELLGVEDITIYDEDSIIDLSKQSLIYRIMNLINNCKSIKQLNLNLSNATLYEYIEAINRIQLRSDLKIDFYRTINRNPLYKGEVKSNLDKCKGRLHIYPEDLIMESDVVLRKLNSIVDDEVLYETDKLKDVVRNVMDYLGSKYDTLKMHPLGKTALVYNYVTNSIRFPNNPTESNGCGGAIVINSEHSRAYPTFINKEGVCEGQARLTKALLNNYDMNIETVVLNGHSGSIGHAWIGVINKDVLYQVCLTGRKLYTRNGYILNDNQLYPTCFPMRYLDENMSQKIKEEVKLYRRR